MEAENNNVNGSLDKLLDGLINVIAEEARLFQQFLEMLERQQRALIENKPDELKPVTQELHRIVARSHQLEITRAETVEEIRLHGGAAGDLNVAQICDMADEARSTQLKNLRETILSLYERIEHTRMRNGLLIEQSMEQIEHTMRLMGKIPAQKSIYKKQGSIDNEYAPVGVDRRV